jgi:ubiquinone/menaquinone biosynthesis C-methylase UbiE
MNLIDPNITNFYNQSSEELRLQMGLGPLEFERNKDLISRYLQKEKLLIADIGGGTGHYAEWLAGIGHDVILIDPVEKHIQTAEKRARRSAKGFKCIIGEARELPFTDHSVDLVILHGPLYHLQYEAERIAALNEAKRVLKTGGRILGFAITYAASTIAALQNGMIHQKDIFLMCKEELLNGTHNPPASFPGILTLAYFHRPSILVDEFTKAGFKIIDLIAVEGIAWLDNKFFEDWASPQKKEVLLEVIKLTEKDAELLCLSPHIMLAAEL